MKAFKARNLWLGELTTNGSSPWTIRNYTGATDNAFATIAERRQVAVMDLELGAIDRDDMVASLAAYVERTDADGVKRKRSQSTMSSFATALRSLRDERLAHRPAADRRPSYSPALSACHHDGMNLPHSQRLAQAGPVWSDNTPHVTLSGGHG